jgi:hypothetical protein
MSLKSPRDDRGLFVILGFSSKKPLGREFYHMAMGICRLCNMHRKLIKAHIIPRSFWNITSKPLAIFSDDGKLRPQKSPDGVYDEEILCEECDNKLGLLDEYTLANLVRNSNKRLVYNNSKPLMEYANLDVFKVHCFILSVAWRASISTHIYYDEIRLGPYQEFFRQAFANPFSGSLCTDVYVAEFDTDVLPYLRPRSLRVGDVNMIVIYANRFKFFVKTDKRNFAAPVDPTELRTGKPIYSNVEIWANSLEKKFADEILYSNPRPKFWKK